MKNLSLNIETKTHLLRLTANNMKVIGGISLNNHLLSIIIYSDSTTCDHLGKTSKHPIYISLGNIPNWMRNKPNLKVLVGYLLKLKAKDNTTRNSEFFRKLQRQVFQRCLRILLSPILNRTDMYFVVKNEIQLFTPKISVILADLAEAVTFTATYLPSTSKKNERSHRFKSSQ